MDPKKPRRSQRHPSPESQNNLRKGPLPSPLTHKDSNATDEFKEGTATPPSQIQPDSTRQAPVRSPRNQTGLSSPPSDTQPFSQFSYPPHNRAYAVDDEEGEGVWGYLLPLDYGAGDPLVLRRRTACPVPSTIVGRTSGKNKVAKKEYEEQEEEYEDQKAKNGVTAGGYLIGRHPECGKTNLNCTSAHVTDKGCRSDNKLAHRFQPALPFVQRD